ncbi:insulin receptor substrate 2-B [Alosa sapidissima]|uniref:insulin receptor substrate 2-B n=1 Tax=Alosa sapidissima TaxID=34773 RepID=UPI001C089252|nr:insulin receptor substrate 2-B [Alosa sapidissima]
MAKFTNYQDSKAAMLMLETQQRALGTKSSATAANGDTSAGEPSSPLINIGGARFQHLPPSKPQNTQPKDHQQYHSSPQQQFSSEKYHHESPVRNSTSCINPVMLDEDSPASVSNAHTVATAACAANANVSAITSSDGVDDIRKCGYLRKQKHGHKRFFVLRASSHLGPSRLEYYDSEKKFRNSVRSAAAACATAASSSGTATTSSPKRVIYLYQCFTVNKRADSKNKHLIALYTKDEYFAIVAENEQEQEDWYLALSEQMSEGKRGHVDADDLDDGYGTVLPGTVFKEVWQVNVKPKGLGQSKNLTGVYRLCLSSKSIHLVKLNSETPCVNLQLMNIRRCGHSESFFFIEVGRSSSIGPGEIWMQVDDSVVAQSMHETILETMKALKAYAEFRPRSKSQSSGSNPIAFITTRRHLGNLPPSQTGLQRRSRTESVVGTPPSSKSSAASGYRFRTSSEGEGTMSRPFRSVTGSLLHLNSARLSLGRQEGSASTSGGSSGGRYVRALVGSTYHTRSASLPVSHFPSTSSPVSVSSSSGHGSVSDTLTRPSSASLCGSPSDGGFNSSDEYGSSPGDVRYFRVRSNTPDSLGNTPPIREEHGLSDYMAMGWQRDPSGAAGESALRDDGAEDDRPANSVRRRTPSFSRQVGGSGGVAMYQKMTQTALSLDEVAGEGSLSSSLRSDYSSSSDHSQARAPQAPHSPGADDGYMPMMPGVGSALTPVSDSDYMPMQPRAALSPTLSPQAHGYRQSTQQQEEDARGYMMMLPRAGRSSAPQPAHPSSAITDPPGHGEYMDMTSARAHHPPSDAHCARAMAEVPGGASTPYFSLPRSYKAPARENHPRDEYVPMSSPAKPSVDPSPLSLASCGGADPRAHSRAAVRPTRLPLGRRSFHGALREAPSSPGEYINIQFAERPPAYASPSGSAFSSGQERQQSVAPPPPPHHPQDDYMSLDVAESCSPAQAPRPSLVAPWNPPTYIRPVTSAASDPPDDYTEMTFGLGRAEASSPTAMLQHLCVLDPHYAAPLTPPQAEPKVIRADLQGRRRHSSETFASASPGPTSSGGGTCTSATSTYSSSSRQADSNRWQSSGSFDNVWMCVDGSNATQGAATTAEAAAPADVAEGSNPVSGYMCRGVSTGYQNGLNYIALDLQEDGRASGALDVSSSPTAGVPLLENGAYASIDFTKSEGLTSTSTD